jgi:hypothetical protein
MKGVILSCDFLHFRTVVYNGALSDRSGVLSFPEMWTDFDDLKEKRASAGDRRKSVQVFCGRGLQLNYRGKRHEKEVIVCGN